MKAIANNVNVVISNDAVKHIKTGHPWIFGKSLIKQNKRANLGDLAVIYDVKRNFIGIGLFDIDSPICIRVLYRGNKAVYIDYKYIKDLFVKALNKRKILFEDELTTGFRLINGENDNLPGIVLDKYENIYVLKLDTVFWLAHLNLLKEIILELLNSTTIILRLSRTVSNSKYCPENYKDAKVIYGNEITNPVLFKENGILFESDVLNGQKTGFFLDQRENRKIVGELSESKRVLNLFSYTGGFSLYAAKSGALSVVSVDISSDALENSKKLFKLNSFDNNISKCEHNTICADVFSALKQLQSTDRLFDIIVIDPPSFARKQSDVKSALSAYKKLVLLSLPLLSNGGILVSASCSSRVKKEDFFKTIQDAISKTGKLFSIIKQTTHTLDHPIGFKEGEYLKCIYLRIGDK